MTERVEESVLQLVRLVFCARLVSRGCLLVSTAVTTKLQDWLPWNWAKLFFMGKANYVCAIGLVVYAMSTVKVDTRRIWLFRHCLKMAAVDGGGFGRARTIIRFVIKRKPLFTELLVYSIWLQNSLQSHLSSLKDNAIQILTKHILKEHSSVEPINPANGHKDTDFKSWNAFMAVLRGFNDRYIIKNR